MKVLCKDDPKKTGKQLGCKDAMRSTLAQTCHDPWQLPRNWSPGSFRGREQLRGPRDRTYRGYLVRENPWLQLQGKRCVLLNFRHAHRDQVRQRSEMTRCAIIPYIAIKNAYSITLSAAESSVPGTSRPIALAVFRLSESTSLVGCWTGMSAGATPLSAWPTSSTQIRK